MFRAAPPASSANPSRALSLPWPGTFTVDVERAGDQRMLGDLDADELALDRAVVEHQHAVAAADQLVIVGRIEQDRGAGVRQLAHQLIEFLLGADIDAARRVVE